MKAKYLYFKKEGFSFLNNYIYYHREVVENQQQVCGFDGSSFIRFSTPYAWFTPQFKTISVCRQKKFSQAEIQNKQSSNFALNPVRQTLVWCGQREVFKRRYCTYVLIMKEDG